MTSLPLCDRSPSQVGVLARVLSRPGGRPRSRRSLLLGLSTVVSVLGGGVVGCSGDSANGPAAALDAGQAYWALQFTQHAIIVALHDTVRLTAVPVNAMGAALSRLGRVTYTPADSSVTVDTTGLVTARYVTPELGTQVIAKLQDPRQRLTHTDTVTIQVTRTPGALGSYQLQPAPGDSAKRAIDFTDDFTGNPTQFSWAVRATDAGGDTVCSASGCTIPVYYTSSNPTIADINHTTGLVSAFDTGRVVFRASTLVDGRVEHDSVVFTVGYALNELLVIQNTVNATTGQVSGGPVLFGVPPQLIMGVGAIVTFTNRTFTPIDIVFDHPENVDSSSSYFGTTFLFGDPTGSGNIPAFGGIYSIDQNTPPETIVSIFDPGNYAARSFPVAGSYHLQSQLFPTVKLTLTIRQETF